MLGSLTGSRSVSAGSDVPCSLNLLQFTMHDAYEPVPILEKLPLQIDCLAAWGESVVLVAPSHLFTLR